MINRIKWIKINYIRKLKNLFLSSFHRKKLKYSDFSIFSNNCWGGFVYNSVGLQYKSPTVGLFIMPSDYVKFLSNLKYYIKQELFFIQPSNSKYFNYLAKNKLTNFPIGKLNDVEIFFQHYKNELEAKNKWNRRCKRINFDKILVKFNDQNNASLIEINSFLNLAYKNKVLFLNSKNLKKSFLNESSYIYSVKGKRNSIDTQKEPIINNDFNIIEILNNL
jgi:uncharacterized protein (DUF1919 family)